MLLLLLAIHATPLTCIASLPSRLILLVDGVSYRDMKALQEGTTYKDLKGRQFHRQGFNENYFPVSRLVSTFPSISDTAWTEILGNRPTPGYQRTYFSAAEGSEIYINGVTSSVEYEKQMTWQNGSFGRVISYVFPQKAFKYEVDSLIENFLKTGSEVTNYYALIHSTDSAQHLSGDIFAMLCALDAKLQKLRALYRAREGKDLEILILSDHGNNHSGGGKRVAVKAFLKKAGYRIAKSIKDPKDIVLPTAGIESWIEIHNSPAETERLAQLLSHLEGVDIVTARNPQHPNQFNVMNSNGDQAVIEWNTTKNSFRYLTEMGDPINYQPVVEALAKRNALDSDGFAEANAWMTESLTHHYPIALERIVRGHTQLALNPATILVSLKNDYVHCEWLIKRGVALVTSGGTHGGLDDINSNGILLSSFKPTKDTSTSRVASLFNEFTGLHDYRAKENGAEWILSTSETVKIAQEPFDGDFRTFQTEKPSLRIWTPAFARLSDDVVINVAIEKAPHFQSAQIRRTDAKPVSNLQKWLKLNRPLPFVNAGVYERLYAIPDNFVFDSQTAYRISGWIHDQKKKIQVFKFTFRTDAHGLPMMY